MPGLNTERDARIVAAVRLGQSHEAVAREHGITRTRVSQIVKASTPPRPPGEAERAALATTLRTQYDRLQQIIDADPPRSSAIGRVVTFPAGHKREGELVTDDSIVIRALAEQGKLVTQYRGLFGVDIHQAPPALIDARSVTILTAVRGEQERRNAIAPAPPLAALPRDYGSLPPAEQARIQIDRHRAQVDAQQAVIAGEITG